MKLLRKKKIEQKGFTIMELMIATLIFGVMLLVISTAITSFSRVYYKGATEVNLQDTSRNIADLISQGIQFNGGTVTQPVLTGSSYAFCIGNQQYSYALSTELSDNPIGSRQSAHVMVVKQVSGAGCPAAQDVHSGTVSGRELMLPGARFTRFQVTNITGTSLYKISMRLVYGDDDLLCSPSIAGDCSSSSLSTGLDNADLRCREVQSGTQFCAISDLTTTVVKRVQ